MVIVKPGGLEYYMDGRLQRNLDKVKKRINKKDMDYVMVVDGSEGSGKSIQAGQIGKYVDPTLNLNRFCFNSSEFVKAIQNAKKGQCVIFDEAFSGLSSRAALSQVNKLIVELMMEMRQKNLFVIIVLPSFFLLDKYVALWRARALIHIYFGKNYQRGFFVAFNAHRKKLIYLIGKKDYSYSSVKSSFRGRFYNTYVVDEKIYRKKKAHALKVKQNMPRLEITRVQRDKLIKYIHKNQKLSLRKLEDLMIDIDVQLKKSSLGEIIKKEGTGR